MILLIWLILEESFEVCSVYGHLEHMKLLMQPASKKLYY